MVSLSKYRESCRRIYGTPGTTERSYYAAIRELLEEHTGPSVHAPIELSVSDGSASDRKLPDLGLFEGKVPLLYVEVKLGVTVAELLADKSGQVYRYAEALGGWALVTNLNDYLLVRIEADALVEHKSVRLFLSDIHDIKPPPAAKGASGQLEDLLLLGCAQRQVARGAREVADLLAVYAKELAGDLPAEHLGLISGAFKDWLGAELDERFLVSTTVQAVVYGMFATWLEGENPAEFRWEEVRKGLGVGAIGEIVYSALPPGVVERPRVESLLKGIAGILRRVDREALAEQFDGQAIEYFYEPFLAAYDPALRDNLGVWYTPREIADYQVARADRHLREDLHVKDGLANSSVVVLDPAVGTGTYLSAVYDHLYESCRRGGYSPRESTAILKDAAENRIVGFDILPAALLVADLNLRRQLRRRGVPLLPAERPAVFLANSLSGWFERDDPRTLPWPAVRKEVEAANRYKHDERILVVLGNPPYHGYSSAETEDERKLVAPWTLPLASEWGIRKHRLNDLYVRFWAAAVRRIAVYTKTGIVSFITNRKWLTGRSYPAMRESLLSDFDKLIVDDLGGDARGSGMAEDESVFTTSTAAGIRVGTAIVTAVRYPDAKAERKSHSDSPRDTIVRMRTVRGSSSKKRTELSQFRGAELDNGLCGWPTDREARWRIGRASESDAWSPIDEYFDYYNSGVQPVRDPLVTDRDRKVLTSRMETYFDPGISWETLTEQHPGFAAKQSRYDGKEVRRKLLGRNADFGHTGIDKTRIVRCLWKPLSGRWLYWEPDHKLLNEARRDLIPYWTVPDQVCLVSTVTRRRPGAAQPLVSTAVPLNEAMDPNVRVLPLWKPSLLHSDDELEFGVESEDRRQPNIRPGWIYAARAVGVEGADNDVAETLFYALCGVAASPKWLAAQPVDHDHFPTIPLPSDTSLIQDAADIGRRYAALVDPWVDVPGVTEPKFNPDVRGVAVPDVPKHGDPILTYGTEGRLGGKIDGRTLLWSEDGGWHNIPPEAITFSLGGFVAIQKHLSYFKGEPLTLPHRQTVTNIVRRIVSILDLAPEADNVFQAAKVAPLEPRPSSISTSL